GLGLDAAARGSRGFARHLCPLRRPRSDGAGAAPDALAARPRALGRRAAGTTTLLASEPCVRGPRGGRRPPGSAGLGPSSTRHKSYRQPSVGRAPSGDRYERPSSRDLRTVDCPLPQLRSRPTIESRALLPNGKLRPRSTDLAAPPSLDWSVSLGGL